MSLRPRPEIENLPVQHHGGINYAELPALGLSPESVLDFSVCTNPFMPPRIKEMRLGDMAVGQYPDSGATELRQRLSGISGIPSANILVGSGTTELIRLIAMTYFRKGAPVLLLEPLIDKRPGTVYFFIDLTFAIVGAAARAVNQTFMTGCNRADAGSFAEEALAALRAGLTEIAGAFFHADK